MKFAFSLALGLALGAAAAPAFAQLSSGGLGSGMGGGGMGGPGGAPAPQPQARTPDIAPSGIPGMAPPTLATTPKAQKSASGDPTQDLFAAINKNDYAAAQDAISRGADLGGHDQFGETPLDLAIALNHNTLTFLILQTRNELAADNSLPLGNTWSLTGSNAVPTKAAKGAHAHPVMQPARLRPESAPRAITITGAGAGAPDPNAGFLGFGTKN